MHLIGFCNRYSRTVIRGLALESHFKTCYESRLFVTRHITNSKPGLISTPFSDVLEKDAGFRYAGKPRRIPPLFLADLVKTKSSSPRLPFPLLTSGRVKDSSA